MTSWQDFAAAEPDFAAQVQRLFESQKHMTLATLRLVIESWHPGAGRLSRIRR